MNNIAYKIAATCCILTLFFLIVGLIKPTSMFAEWWRPLGWASFISFAAAAILKIWEKN